MLQKAAPPEAPKADAKPAEAAKADSPKPAEGTQPTPAEGDKKPAEAKPAEPAKDAAKPEGEKPKDAAAEKPAESAKPEPPAPVEYKYALPESIKLDDTKKGELHGLLDAFRADPANVQPLIDYHAARMIDAGKEIEARNRNIFNEMRAENRKAIMADPVIGGSGHRTTAQAVARMRDLLTPPDMMKPRTFADGKARLSELDEFLEHTGAGDHPVFWRILHNAARYLDEPQASQMPSNVKPPKDIGKAPRGRLRQMYDHPRSNGQS